MTSIIFKKSQDEFGYLNTSKSANKYYAINNSGPYNKGYRIKLSNVFMSNLLDEESTSGFTTHTKIGSLDIKPEELAMILKKFVNSPDSKEISVYLDGYVTTLSIHNNSYGVVNKVVGLWVDIGATTGRISNIQQKDKSELDIIKELKQIRKELKSLTAKINKIKQKL